MSKPLLAALFVLLATGGFCDTRAQKAASSKAPGYPSYVYTGKWYGYVTDSMDIRQGYKATAEQIRKNVAEKGATFVLYNPHGGRLGLNPQEKVAPFAGQRVFVTASITSKEYGTGPTAADEITENGGFANPERGNITTLTVISVTATDLRDAYDPIVETIPGATR